MFVTQKRRRRRFRIVHAREVERVMALIVDLGAHRRGDRRDPLARLRIPIEAQALHAQPQRHQRPAGLIGAVKNRGHVHLGMRAARLAHDLQKPGRAGIGRGAGTAHQHDGRAKRRGGGERRLRLGERMNDDRFRGSAQPSLPSATAVSLMRLEKPHSLSYQASTLSSLPLDLVWLASKIDDSGLWLKSLETSGKVL